MSGTVPNSWIDRLVNKIGRSGSFDKVNDFVKDLGAEGFSITKIISQVNKNYQKKNFFCHHDALKIYGAPRYVVCTVYVVKSPVFSLQRGNF